MNNDITQQQAQNFYNKGVLAFERRNLDIAIDLLTQCVQISPGFTRARKTLRAAQIARFRGIKKNSFAQQVQDLKASAIRVKIQGLLKAGKNELALQDCEKLLSINPLNADNINLAIACADACKMPDCALFTVEAALENNPNDMDMLRRAGDYYMQVGEYALARDAYVKLNAVRPRDQVILKLLKDAEARTTMAAGWEENAGQKGGYRNLIRDKEQAKKLDMKNKQITQGDDADALIEEAKAKIANEPANLNLYRALARIYSQNKRYADAIATLEDAKKVNPADPELDRALTAAKTNLYNQQIDALLAAGDEEGAADKTQERDQFVFDDLLDRVQRYPNDLKLHFDLGCQYYMYEYWDDAIGQFQQSQRSPKERLESLYYLAMCFANKGQTDMAVMQLETAASQIDIMDDLKKRIVFALGDLAEKSGKIDKAFEYYKDVYGADIAYEDIGERFQRVYKLRQEQQG